jgi:hypothetical protein
MGFPSKPGNLMPDYLQQPVIRYTLRSHFTDKDGRGRLTGGPAARRHPAAGVKVDADRNEDGRSEVRLCVVGLD